MRADEPAPFCSSRPAARNIQAAIPVPGRAGGAAKGGKGSCSGVAGNRDDTTG